MYVCRENLENNSERDTNQIEHMMKMFIFILLKIHKSMRIIMWNNCWLKGFLR